MVDAGGEAVADQTVVIVHIGASNTAIIIVRKGLLAFVRTIPTAGAALTSAIRQNMTEDEASAERVKRLFADLSGSYAYEAAEAPAGEATSAFDAIGEVEDADSVFEMSDADQHIGGYGEPDLDEAATQLEMDTSQTYAVPPTTVAPVAGAETPVATAPAPAPVPPEIEAVRSQVYEAIAQPLLDLATEVRRSLDFYRRGHRDEDIDHLYLSGGSAVIPGLASFLGAEIGMAVEVANPFEYVVVGDEVTDEFLNDVGPMCVIAVGLAMRDMFD